MSSSLINPVPPKAVKLTQAGQDYWNGYTKGGQVSACGPDDAYVVVEAAWWHGAEHYNITQAHSYSSLWVDRKHCIGIAYNSTTGEWEVVE